MTPASLRPGWAPRRQTFSYPTSSGPLSSPPTSPLRRKDWDPSAILRHRLCPCRDHLSSSTISTAEPAPAALFKPLCVATALPAPGELSCPQQVTDRSEWIISELLGSVRVGSRGWVPTGSSPYSPGEQDYDSVCPLAAPSHRSGFLPPLLVFYFKINMYPNYCLEILSGEKPHNWMLARNWRSGNSVVASGPHTLLVSGSGPEGCSLNILQVPRGLHLSIL